MHGRHAVVDERAAMGPVVYVPTGHSAAATEPATQNEPAGHGVQPPDDATFVLAEKEPVGHCVGATLPAGQKLAAGHAVHPAWLTRPVVAP